MKKTIVISLLIGLMCFNNPVQADTIPLNFENGYLNNEGISIYINLWIRKLYIVENGERIKTYAIAPGAPETPTPIGDYKVVEKSANWGKGFGSRWLGLDVPFGKYGIHGTNKPHLIGAYVSHGCIRMRNEDIEEIFPLINIDTPVRIEGPILGREGLDFRILVRGSKGSLVLIVQNRLRAAGYYSGPVDGIFTYELEFAVKRYQHEHELPVTGQIQFEDLVEFGLVE